LTEAQKDQKTNEKKKRKKSPKEKGQNLKKKLLKDQKTND